MTVRELIGLLQAMPPGALVIQSKDAEGNKIMPVMEVSACHYIADTDCYGDLAENEDAPSVPAVIFYPC
jgi:hypothetical protein